VSRPAVLAFVALVAACGGESAPPNPMPKPIAAVERRIQSPFRGVAIAADGIYYDRKKLSTLADFEGAPKVELAGTLTHARAAAGPASADVDDPPSIAMGVVVVPDSLVTPALLANVLAVVRRAGWQNINLKFIHTDAEDPRQHDLENVCDLVASGFDRSGGDPDDGPVNLSLLIQPDRMWLGLSRVNEFQEIPRYSTDHDYEKLEATLKEHKVSAFFADRTDLEIAVEGAQEVTVLLTAIFAACRVGFTDVTVYDPAQLSARPTL
jgi:hypothetical protein